RWVGWDNFTKNLVGILVQFFGDRTLSGNAGGRNSENERLSARIAGTERQHLPEPPVSLRVDLVENDAMTVEPVLPRHIRRQRPVETARMRDHDALAGIDDLR